MDSPPLLIAKELSHSYKGRSVIKGVSFTLEKGEIVGLIGKSGSGKSTLARALLCLPKPDQGTIFFDGEEITCLSQGDLRKRRRRMQMVFQDPFSTLTPSMRVADLVREGLLIHCIGKKEEHQEAIAHYLELVGLLPQRYLNRYPDELSGGERQRVSIARALAVQPDLLICDEILSALDATHQMEVVQLLVHLKDKLGLTLLFISHNRALIHKICPRTLLINEGKLR